MSAGDAAPRDPRTSPPQLIIWDCDGVLVDSERLGVAIDVEMIGQLGVEITHADVVEHFMGRSGTDFTRGVEDLLGHPVPAGWSESVQRRYIERFAESLQAVPGVAGALSALAGAGVRMCVASSSEPERLRWKLDHCGLSHWFGGAVYSAVEVEHGKPAPDLFLRAAAVTDAGFAPDACVVIEDSVSGVLAGRAAGMRTLGFAGGLAPRARLLDAGGEPFDAMDELPGRLLYRSRHE